MDACAYVHVGSSVETDRKRSVKTKTSHRSSRSHIYDYVKDEEKVMYGFYGAGASDSDESPEQEVEQEELEEELGAKRSPFQGSFDRVEDSDASLSDSVTDDGLVGKRKEGQSVPKEDRRTSASFEARRLQNELRTMLRAAFSEQTFTDNLTPVHHSAQKFVPEDTEHCSPSKPFYSKEVDLDDDQENASLLETVRRLSMKEAEAHAALSQALEDNAALTEELLHWRIVNKEAALARRAARDALSQVSTENARLQAANNAQRLEIRTLNEKIRLQRSKIEDLECLLAASESQREAYAEALATATLASPKRNFKTSEVSSKSKHSQSSSSGETERQELLSLLERLQEELAKSSHAGQTDKATENSNQPPSTPFASPSPPPFLSKPSPGQPSKASRDEQTPSAPLCTPVASGAPAAPSPSHKQGVTTEGTKRHASTAPPAVPLARSSASSSRQVSLAVDRAMELKSAAEKAVSCKKFNDAIDTFTAGLQCLQETNVISNTDSANGNNHAGGRERGEVVTKLVEDLLCSRAAAFKEIGRLLDSAADCCRVLSTHPSCLQARLLRAETYFQMDAFDLAAEDFEHVLKRRSVGLARHQVMGMTSKLRYARSSLSNSAPRNHYAILGLKHTASSSEIKRAYRQLALKLHPDKAAALMGSQYATCLFALLSSAYATLSNARSRQQYDMSYSVRRMYSPFGGQHKSHASPVWRTR
jgi:hypothetical protein